MSAVPLQVGLQVKNPTNGHTGRVTAVSGSRANSFQVQFGGGAPVERLIENFQTIDGRPLSAPGSRYPAVDSDSDLEDEPVNPARRLTKDLALEIRMGFVRKVYAILSMQLLVTAAIAGFICKQSNEWLVEFRWLLILAMVGSICCFLLLCCFRKYVRRYPFCFLILFTGCHGILLGFFTAAYTWQSVALAFVATSLIFIFMTIYAWTTSTDFTGYAPYFHAALFVFFVFGLVLFVMRLMGIHIDWLIMVYDIFGVLLFTAKIVFDTQRILGEYGGHEIQFRIDDWMFASLCLYRDFTQIFRHLLRLTGQRDPGFSGAGVGGGAVGWLSGVRRLCRVGGVAGRMSR